MSFKLHQNWQFMNINPSKSKAPFDSLSIINRSNTEAFQYKRQTGGTSLCVRRGCEALSDQMGLKNYRPPLIWAHIELYRTVTSIIFINSIIENLIFVRLDAKRHHVISAKALDGIWPVGQCSIVEIWYSDMSSTIVGMFWEHFFQKLVPFFVTCPTFNLLMCCFDM